MKEQDKEFDEAMGEEELVPAAKSYSFQGEKGFKEEEKVSRNVENEGMAEKKELIKEYLEKPNAFGENDFEAKNQKERIEKANIDENKLKA